MMIAHLLAAALGLATLASAASAQAPDDPAAAFGVRESVRSIALSPDAGPHVREGSPAQNAAAIRAPVLMLHGALDRNVNILQARVMRDRLRDAGRQVELVEFDGLDHQLEDSAARTQMLRRSDEFLRQALGIR